MRKDRTERILTKTVEQLKELRQGKNLSHESLAQSAGVTRPAISHIEGGKRKPSLLVCLRLAEALGVELSEIIKKSERSVPK